MKKRYFMAALFVGFVFFIAANTATAGIIDRIQNQEERIDKGVASGALTRDEAVTLRDNLNWIRTRFSTMTADGRLTPRETQKLDRMLDRTDKMIRNKKHNVVRRVY